VWQISAVTRSGDRRVISKQMLYVEIVPPTIPINDQRVQFELARYGGLTTQRRVASLLASRLQGPVVEMLSWLVP
jgi:hypothetical protein